jgi:hypothetical protein
MEGAATAPRLLLAAACCWESTVPLAVALRNAGFQIYALAPKQHPIRTLSGLSGYWPYRPLAPSASLRRAIEAVSPSVVMPCDEPSMALVQRLCRDDSLAPQLRAAIERSIGTTKAAHLLASRSSLCEIATRSGVRAPQSATIGSARDLLAWLRANGNGAYLKIDRSTGGKGVVRVTSKASALIAYFRLRLLFGFPRLAWLWMRWGDLSTLPLVMAGSRAEITVQQAVDGTPANCAMAVWQGKLHGCVSVEALETRTPTGVATVVRVRDDALMEEAARKVAAEIGLSGLHGLDFILENGSGTPWLIEVNGRPTQTAYLRLGPGRDLVGALYAAITGQREKSVGVFKAQEVITLFEQASGARVWPQGERTPQLAEEETKLPLELPAVAKAALSS